MGGVCFLYLVSVRIQNTSCSSQLTNGPNTFRLGKKGLPRTNALWPIGPIHRLPIKCSVVNTMPEV